MNILFAFRSPSDCYQRRGIDRAHSVWQQCHLSSVDDRILCKAAVLTYAIAKPFATAVGEARGILIGGLAFVASATNMKALARYADSSACWVLPRRF